MIYNDLQAHLNRTNLRIATRQTALTLLALALASFVPSQLHAEPRNPSEKKTETYDTDVVGRDCEGFPQIPVASLDGTCLGLVVPSKAGLKMPRAIVELANHDFLITDMGSWEPNTGTVWLLQRDSSGRMKSLVNLFPKSHVDRPHGIALDPEGRAYIGTPLGIFRFNATRPSGNSNIEPKIVWVVRDLHKMPTDFTSTPSHRHPLTSFVASFDFTELYINLGAPTDQCLKGRNAASSGGPCLQVEGDPKHGIPQQAGILKVTLAGPDRTESAREMYAVGLRNSVALALTPSGQQLLQGENGHDLPEADEPPEEINLIERGKHYGWPYCFGQNKVNPKFANFINSPRCPKNTYTEPIALMPAHSAPLSMLYGRGSLISELAGRLVIAWHGYRPTGHRIVTYDVDAQGIPNGTPREIVFGWTEKFGVRPEGAPTSLLEATDGGLWIVEDKNKTLLRLGRGQSYVEAEDETHGFVRVPPKYQELETRVLVPKCASCHGFQSGNAKFNLELINSMGWVVAGNPAASKLYQVLKDHRMPKDGSLAANSQEFSELLKLVENVIRTF